MRQEIRSLISLCSTIDIHDVYLCNQVRFWWLHMTQFCIKLYHTKSLFGSYAGRHWNPKPTIVCDRLSNFTQVQCGCYFHYCLLTNQLTTSSRCDTRTLLYSILQMSDQFFAEVWFSKGNYEITTSLTSIVEFWRIFTTKSWGSKTLTCVDMVG